MNTLAINTTSNKEIIVILKTTTKEYVLKQPITSRKAQMVLPLILKLLNEYHLTVENINAIIVNPGPGSFTGIRVGISIANALAYTLQIPVNSIMFKDTASLVEPKYTA